MDATEETTELRLDASDAVGGVIGSIVAFDLWTLRLRTLARSEWMLPTSASVSGLVLEGCSLVRWFSPF